MSANGSSTGPLCDRDAVDLADDLRAGRLSAREVMTAHLERIEQVNPAINAIVTLDAERALEAAAAADRRHASGAELGPLHGLPLAVKDTNDTAGMRTTFGCTLFADNVPMEDELVVERVRAGGAIVLGKTNVPEFGFGSHTFNRVFGPTRNPYAPDRSAGGSSGGAAAALATGMVPLADGSDMGGSLRNPASFCNVVGFRPTPGRVPTWPNPLPWTTLAVQGPMGRTVRDAALLLSVQAGPDPRAPLSLAEPGETFRGTLDRDLRGLRVAWSSDLGGSLPVDAAVITTLLPQLAVLEQLGCTVEEASIDFAGAEQAFRTQRAWQSDHLFGELVAKHPEHFKQTLRDNVEMGRFLTGADVAEAQRLQGALVARAATFFEKYDVLLLPVSQVPPFDIELEYPTSVAGVPQDSYLDWMRSAYYVTATCCPAISVPAGFTAAGLPVGLQVVGPMRRDRRVLEVAHAFEQATRAGRRRPPIVEELR
jgi:amidase